MSRPSKKSSTVMDVSKPGKIAPTASSRPIIVGHKPTVQDPMVTEDRSATSEEHKVDVKRTAPKVITPLDVVKEPENVDEPVMSETVSEPSTDEAETPVEEDTTTEQAQSNVADEKISGVSDAVALIGESKSAKDSKGKSSSVVDAVVGQAAKEKDKKSDKKIEELEKRQAEIEKLIEDKKYFVRTTQVTKKQRKTRWVTIILAFLLLVGAYLAIDAQVIKNNIQLPYEFFKENQNSSADETNHNVPSSSTSDAKSPKQKPLEYENKEYGFGFTIPAEWAALIDSVDEIVYEDLAQESESGKAYIISPGIKFIGGFVTRDWKAKGSGDSNTLTRGFAAYEACPHGRARFVKTLYKDENTCVVAQAFAAELEGEFQAMSVLVQRKIESEKIAGLQFVSTPVALNDLSQAGLESLLEEVELTEHNKRIVGFAKSIKQL